MNNILHDMNFRDLEYIIALAEEKSFHKAANRCFVSQPALSMQVKKLESELNVSIFERTKKKVIVTSIGKHIITNAEKILKTKQIIYDLIPSDKSIAMPLLKLGIFPTLAQYILPGIILNIKEGLASIQLYPIEEKSDVLMKMLHVGEIDFALLAAPILHPDITFIPLFKDDFTLAIYPGHPLNQKKKIQVDDIKRENILLLEKGHCLRDQIQQLNPHSILSIYESTSLETLRQMVAVKLGITIIPKIATINHLDENVIYKKFEKPIPSRTI
jgi:LysR family transcriptional regulator, hydrogen peroxide-inducible genes activator